MCELVWTKVAKRWLAWIEKASAFLAYHGHLDFKLFCSLYHTPSLKNEVTLLEISFLQKLGFTKGVKMVPDQVRKSSGFYLLSIYKILSTFWPNFVQLGFYKYKDKVLLFGLGNMDLISYYHQVNHKLFGLVDFHAKFGISFYSLSRQKRLKSTYAIVVPNCCWRVE